jgi:beta-aspartyl-peptidase (threonine type)
MRKLAILLLASFTAFAGTPFGIAIHGGAGNVTAERIGTKEKAYREGLEKALARGYQVLEKGGSALDAVEAAVRAMEENPLFNAGVGATLTRDGTHELDSAIMDGKTLKAGSVAGIMHVKSPVGLARLVMERTPHVMLIGAGAEAFAKSEGMELVPNAYFDTQAQTEALKKLKEKEAKRPTTKDTVGAVALDRNGNLAAATSTGGMLNKLPGRVGDAPLIGVGTYADNRTCAVSCTGWGEFFIRTVVAYDITAQMAYKGETLDKAARASLDKALKLGGDGGLVAMDKEGRVSMPFTSAGMFRAFRLSDGTTAVKLFAGE